MKSKYKRLQGEEWHKVKHKMKLKKVYINKKGNIKGYYSDGNTTYTHWLNDEEKELYNNREVN